MSSSPKLSRAWRTWRESKRREFVAAGMDFDVAGKIATKDARARQLIADTIGGRAAELANVTISISEDGTVRTFVAGAKADLPTDAHRRLFDLLSPETGLYR